MIFLPGIDGVKRIVVRPYLSVGVYPFTDIPSGGNAVRRTFRLGKDIPSELVSLTNNRITSPVFAVSERLALKIDF